LQPRKKSEKRSPLGLLVHTPVHILFPDMRKLNWIKDNPNSAHKVSEAKLTDGSTLVLYFISRRNGWCLYRLDAEGNQVGEGEYAMHKAALVKEAKEIATKLNGN